MKVLFYLLPIFFTLEALALTGMMHSSSRRQEEARLEKMNKLCNLEKAEIGDKEFTCDEDSRSFLLREYESYLQNHRSFNRCLRANESYYKEKAEEDLKNTYCIRRAEAAHPKLAAQIAKERESFAKIIFGILFVMIGGFLSVVIWTVNSSHYSLPKKSGRRL